MIDETTSEQLAEIEGQPEPVQVREGRWEMRGGHHVRVGPMSGDDFDAIAYGYTWRGIDWPDLHWNDNGVHLIDSGARSKWDLVTYLGPIEPQPEAQPQPEPAAYYPPDGWRLLPIGETLQKGDIWVRPSDGRRFPTKRVGSIVRANQRYIRPIEPESEPEPEPQPADTADELRSEVSHVQRLLGESRQRVTALEELVTSLRTINTAQEQAVERANKETEKLALQWEAVKAELTIAAAVCQQLQIELDAAQQVPADSPELRQLRSDLAEMTRDRDDYRRAHELWVQDANTAHERTRAMTVEAIIEWLQPFRGCKNPALALPLLEALPHIMRSLTGLADEEIE